MLSTPPRDRTLQPLKAGGYAIQGLAAAFIECMEGSYTDVMGLAAFATAELLARVGPDLPGLTAGEPSRALRC